MTTTNHVLLASAACLSDLDLLDATVRAAGDERRTTAQLIALLAELDSRKLYLGEGYSSLFSYCRHRLHLSEFSAYSRIAAARTARRFPLVLGRLTEGAVSLTSIGLLSAHLTEENHEALLDAVQHASKRDVECLVASLYGQPDIPTSIRRLPDVGVVSADATATALPVPVPGAVSAMVDPGRAGAVPVSIEVSAVSEPTRVLSAGLSASPDLTDATAETKSRPPSTLASLSSDSLAMPQSRRDVVAPLAVGRYLLRVTITAETHARLDRARDLLRHVVPDGDLALILDRALAVLVDHLERRKFGGRSKPARRSSGLAGRTGRPSRRARRESQPRRSRHIPASVRREVWARDQGRCTFAGPRGRCSETGFLEFHHVVPFARGGSSDAVNVVLRCRAHNAYEADREFGDGRPRGAGPVRGAPER